MNRKPIRIASLCTILALASVSVARAQAPADDLIRQAFSSSIGDGTLTASDKALSDHLAANATDDNARFALGLTRFLLSGERMLGDMYRHGGFNTPITASMMMDMGRGQNFAFNPDPEPITHDQWRASVQRWIDDVRTAEATLAEIKAPDVKIRVPIGLTRMDLNADGKAAEDEHLWQFFLLVQRRFTPTPEEAAAFEIAMDRGDVDWLRGYCNLCMALGEFILAHETTEVFDRVGHVIFPKSVTPYEYLKGPRAVFEPIQDIDVVDVIAMVHLIRLRVADAPRLERVRMHLLQTVTLGESMWAAYDAETDDDCEWIPSPKQANGAIPNALINAEQRDAWLMGLGEGKALLEGARLLRFWRGDGSKGVNFRRALTESTEFDLVLWVQGSAAGPFLEQGEFTKPGTWSRLMNAFNGTVFRYGWWLN
jgi:hypothetical protein